MSAADPYLAAARSAAEDWGLDAASVELLSSSENLVYAVEREPGDEVVLRLHRPGYNDRGELESEVLWVDSLRESGIPVPRSVRHPSGAAYTTVSIGRESRHVGVVERVAGRAISDLQEDLEPPQLAGYYHRIGELAADIRRHAETWDPPADFARRSWDAAGLLGDAPLWGPFWDAPSLDSSQRHTLTMARDRLRSALAGYGRGRERYGLIHADLHLGNVLVDGDEVTLIDFDDAGFGYFAHELAVALHPVFGEGVYPDARQALLAGYRSRIELDAEEEASIDTFLVVRTLMLIGWLTDRPELPVHRHLPDLVRAGVSVAERYLETGGL